MNDWRGIVAAVAPTLATALGGPLAGLAVRTLSSVLLGNENGSQGDIAAALNGATGDQMVRLREADAAFAVQMRSLDVDLERIAAADRGSARVRESNSGDTWTPRLIAALTLGGFLFSVFWVLTGRVAGLTDPVTVGIMGTLIGYVSAKADQVVSYYFGSSAGSAAKNAALADALAQGVRK